MFHCQVGALDWTLDLFQLLDHRGYFSIGNELQEGIKGQNDEEKVGHSEGDHRPPKKGPLPEATSTESDQIRPLRPNPTESDQIRPNPTKSD